MRSGQKIPALRRLPVSSNPHDIGDDQVDHGIGKHGERLLPVFRADGAVSAFIERAAKQLAKIKVVFHHEDL